MHKKTEWQNIRLANKEKRYLSDPRPIFHEAANTGEGAKQIAGLMEENNFKL